jgi:hypothetical protein
MGWRLLSSTTDYVSALVATAVMTWIMSFIFSEALVERTAFLDLIFVMAMMSIGWSDMPGQTESPGKKLSKLTVVVVRQAEPGVLTASADRSGLRRAPGPAGGPPDGRLPRGHAPGLRVAQQPRREAMDGPSVPSR